MVHCLAKLLCFLLACSTVLSAVGAAKQHQHNTLQVNSHTAGSAEHGELMLVQVVFRHGARTPLSNVYWPDTQWTKCREHHPGSASLSLYDATGRSLQPPVITDTDAPILPGGCRMGRLTDNGHNMALQLGQHLRQRYIQQYKLLPEQYSPSTLLAETTAVQRTVLTLQGVLAGLYPGTTDVIPVAARSAADEIMIGNNATCAALELFGEQLQQLLDQADAQDAHLHQLIRVVQTALNLPPHTPLLWNRLRDTLSCMAADDMPLPLSKAAAQQLLPIIDAIATQHKLAVLAPDAVHCLASRLECEQVVRLTIGLLLRDVVAHMESAAAAAGAAAAAAVDGGDGGAGVSAVGRCKACDSSSSMHRKIKLGVRVEGPAAGTGGGSAGHSYQQMHHQLLLVTAQQQQQQRRQRRQQQQGPDRQVEQQRRQLHVGGSSQQGQQQLLVKQPVQAQQQRQQQQLLPSALAANQAASVPAAAGAAPIAGKKLVLYSAHDTTLMPLLAALGQQQQSWPHFVSYIAFELWRQDSGYFVRVVHDDVPLNFTAAGVSERVAAAAAAAAAAAGESAESAVLTTSSSSSSHGSTSGLLANRLQAQQTSSGSSSSILAGPSSSSSSILAAPSSRSLVEFGEFKRHVVHKYMLGKRAHEQACRLPGKHVQ